MPIFKLTDEEYFAIDAISNSKLSRLAKCPAAMNIEIEPTASMILGTLAHCLILEGSDVFYKRYAVGPFVDKRTKEGKAEWQAFLDDNPGKTLITIDQIQAVLGMATSVAAHPACQDLLAEGEPEQAILWEEEGLNCKAKADWLAPSALIDLKTCQDSSYGIFSKTVVNMGYYRQFAFYNSGLAANGVYPEFHICIAVETKPPYTVNVYSIESDLLEAGEGQYKELLRKFKQTQNLSVLPAYTDAGIQSLYCPQWMKEAFT